jgi:hypothetical protein
MSNVATQQSREIAPAPDTQRELIIKEFAHVVKAMAYRLASRLYGCGGSCVGRDHRVDGCDG